MSKKRLVKRTPLDSEHFEHCKAVLKNQNPQIEDDYLEAAAMSAYLRTGGEVEREEIQLSDDPPIGYLADEAQQARVERIRKIIQPPGDPPNRKPSD